MRAAAVGAEHDAGDSRRGEDRAIRPEGLAAPGRRLTEPRRCGFAQSGDDRLVLRDFERRPVEACDQLRLERGVRRFDFGEDRPYLLGDARAGLARRGAALDLDAAFGGVTRPFLAALDQRGVD